MNSMNPSRGSPSCESKKSLWRLQLAQKSVTIDKLMREHKQIDDETKTAKEVRPNQPQTISPNHNPKP